MLIGVCALNLVLQAEIATAMRLVGANTLSDLNPSRVSEFFFALVFLFHLFFLLHFYAIMLPPNKVSPSIPRSEKQKKHYAIILKRGQCC